MEMFHNGEGMDMHWRRTVVAGCAVALVTGMGMPAQAAGGYRWARAVDGDTIELSNGRDVRLLGYDTPEYGTCGYRRATAQMTRLISGGVRLVNVTGVDRYGRTLAYVSTRDGRDVGTVMLRKGLAVARYDGLDGYGWHPKQQKYRALDRTNGGIKCGSGSPASTYYANCTVVREAGKAPIRRGDPGYGPHLDRDGDGVACE